MGKTFMGSAALLVAFGLGLQPAEARDQKAGSSRAVSEAKTQPVVVQHAAVSSAAAPGSTRRSSFVNQNPDDQEAVGAETGRRKAITLFRFSSRLGDVAVQPVAGSVTGAQFSLGF